LNRLYSTLLHSNIDAYQRWMDRLLAGLCLLLGIGMAGFGLWLQRMARQTRLERRWPPSAMKTSTDVRIRYLTSADAFVQQLLAAVWLLWFLAFALAAWAGWLLFAP
jgi:CHASE1-domain containing sensor protein